MSQEFAKFSQLPLDLAIQPQPDETTCGPTCLQAVYRYWGDDVPLAEVIRTVHGFEEGGTLAVWLGCHALQRGYKATLYTCNLRVFDPTWFKGRNIQLADKIRAQLRYKKERKLQRASHAYLDFLSLGGDIHFDDFTRALLRRYLIAKIPILTGLSSTFLYRSAREYRSECNDVRGVSTGHFVVLYGYDRETKEVYVADPYQPNPYSSSQKYRVHIERVICAMLLGILTYDANFLVIKPQERTKQG